MNKLTLDTLAAFPSQLEQHYRLIPDSHRNWAPASWDGVPSEPLTAIEQVCHVLDIEVDGYQRRFRRTLSETDPLLESIDTEALARERNYAAADATKALQSFRRARAETVALLAELRADQWARTASFEGYGPVTLRSLAHYLCSHDQQHLAGLQWLMGKMGASR